MKREMIEGEGEDKDEKENFSKSKLYDMHQNLARTHESAGASMVERKAS